MLIHSPEMKRFTVCTGNDIGGQFLEIDKLIDCWLYVLDFSCQKIKDLGI